MSPSKVNLKALDSRLSTIFSHISRSNQTGPESGGHSITSRIPARSMAERKVLANSAVKLETSTGSYDA